MKMFWSGGVLLLSQLLGCSGFSGRDTLGKAGEFQTPCGTGFCQTGFHCEFDACVSDTPPPLPPQAGRTDPLASGRYVFVLERDNKRLVRIDSATLGVTSYNAGASPLALGIVGSRELTLLLDGYDLVEVFDHRNTPPTSAAYDTARSLSHIALSPTGEHAVLYYDWDDPQAATRQPLPGNINQISVLFVGDASTEMNDEDPRILNVAVGFLPRDVRFSQDGNYAVVIGKDTLTRLALSAEHISVPLGSVQVDTAALEILVNADATRAITRYAGSDKIDVVDLQSGEVRCFQTLGKTVSDIALSPQDELLALVREGGTAHVLRTSVDDAGVSCTPVIATVAVGASTTMVVDPTGDYAVAYAQDLSIETAWVVNTRLMQAVPLPIEKAVSAVAFVGDGEHALIAHLKKPGVPQWNSGTESPEDSVDKAYGVSWLATSTREHRLAVSGSPFGAFAFVPSAQDGGVTFQAVNDVSRPQLLRVTHQPGFDDAWIDLAALPVAMGYLPTTQHTYVTQDHPWGRVTFVDAPGKALRHVTGFALENN